MKCHTKKCKRKNKKSKKRMNGGGGSQSRPTVQEDTTPRAEVVKQLKYKFINDDGDNNTLILKDFTAKDLEYKTPQLGNAEGKGEYIIDLVYDQESEGFNDYRDAKSRIFDVIATQEKKIEELDEKIKYKRNELRRLFRIMTPDQNEKIIAEIDKIEKEKDVINERLDHLDAIESYLLSYSTDVHHIPQEGKITELGKRRRSARFLPVAIQRGGKRKTRKQLRKMNGGGGTLSRFQTNSTIYNSEGHPIVSPDDIIYIKTSWKSGREPKYESTTISSDLSNGYFAHRYVNVKFSNYNWNWKFTSTNGDFNPDITERLNYYKNLLLELRPVNSSSLDERWQIKLKIYQLHAIRKFFNTENNNAIAEFAGGKSKKKKTHKKSNKK